MTLRPIILVALLLFPLSGICTAQTRDSVSQKKKRSPFANVQELTTSDYLAAIDRANDLMNTTRDQGEFRGRTKYIFQEISDTNESISLITENINQGSNTNIRNQRMYEKVLLGLDQKLEKYQVALDAETGKILELKKHLRTVMKDTVFSKMVRDSILREQYSDQLKPLRVKFFAVDSVLKRNLNILNTHKSENTRKKLLVSEAWVVVNDRLDKSGNSIFNSECPNLWDSKIKVRNQDLSSFIAQKFGVEISALAYYFKYNLGRGLLLLLVMVALFLGVRYNLRSLKAYEKLAMLDEFGFRALNHGTLFPMVVVGLNIAFTWNLYAPALYIEVLHFLLLAVLSAMFIRRWPGKAYRRWLLLVAVFAALSFIDLFFKITLLQRMLFIVINIVCIRFGISHLKYIKEQLFIKVLFTWANYIFVIFNILAIFFNVFGRVTLAYTLSLTAIIALTQMIALSVMLRIILEAAILQVYAIRLRRGITKLFDVEALERNVQKPFFIVILFMWIVVLASNLNLSDTLYDLFDKIVSRPNKIGSFTFTIGGILLFIFIIWLAHLLQKLAAYFFGGIDGEYGESVNKRQHSRLLITRLAVLVCGYLLAIAASGMPLDKITIILGALGVGVGLGLQSVVSNFVSGVILIFERPIQIGDLIDSGTQSGSVKEIGLRTTRLTTRDGAEVIIPNGNILAQNIVNWTRTDDFRQVELGFTVSGQITHIEIREVIESALKGVPDIDHETPYEVFFESFSSDKYKVKTRFWANIYRSEQALSEARMALYEGFGKREVVMED
jgi:potassium efflux system protein